MSKRENPVDHVLDRMVEAVLGENAHFKSHAEALGIPQDTIKTWRRRGNVPPGYLSNFARDWKTSVDYLLLGAEGVVVIEAKPTLPGGAAQQVAAYGLKADERKLLENYRKVPAEVKETLQLVASIASRPQASAAAPARSRQTTPPVVLDTEHKGRRAGPQIIDTKYAVKRTRPQVVGKETKAAPKKNQKDDAS